MSEVTLDNCAREPIHIPGAIQPHGVLLACRGPALTIAQVSANVGDLVVPARLAPEAVLGQPLAAVLEPASAALVADAASRPSLRETNPLTLLTRDGQRHTAVLHRSGDLLVVEMERSDSEVLSAGFDPRLRASVMRLQGAREPRRLSAIAAEEVRALTGFDRVMVYRFDPEWNGEVVAEARRDDLEPFLGLHYPASDIPAQARRLYTENWLRLIADVGYTPSPLVPPLDPSSGAALDLSHAFLRSVSPIHVQYLRNMGVTASMSISLVIDGVLVGLLACHHYAGARLVPFAVRETVEYLGQALSWHLRVLETADEAERARRVQVAEAAVLSAVTVSADLLDGLATPALVSLTDARGAAVVLEEGTRRVGETPSAEVIEELVAWLKSEGHEVFATDRLAAHLPAAESWDGRVSGLLAVAVSKALGEYLLWFRPSTERTVDWAGDPRKQPVLGDAPERLSPRGSFALWREIVRGRSLPWERWHVDAASRIRSVLLGGVRERAAQLRSINDRLREADRAKDTFIATVSHELRTPLNAISGWVAMLRNAQVKPAQTGHAMEVIARNTETLKQLVEDLLDVSRIASGKLSLEVVEVDLSAVIEGVCDALVLSADAKGIRLKRTLDTKDSVVLGDPTRLRQILTNLISNAVKFTPKGGSVHVKLRRLSSDVEIEVSDSGQGIEAWFLPQVLESFRQADGAATRRVQGLGLGLAIVKKLVELHGGSVTAESDGADRGSTFRVRLPTLSVRRTPTEPLAPAASASPEIGPSLEGLRVLVVEDEPDSRDLLVHLLEQCHATVTAAADAASALAMLDRETFDVMVSDIGLPEMDGLALMREVRTRTPEANGAIRAVALTAYTRSFDRTSALVAGYQAHVPKPADPSELVTVVASLADRLGRRS